MKMTSIEPERSNSPASVVVAAALLVMLTTACGAGDGTEGAAADGAGSTGDAAGASDALPTPRILSPAQGEEVSGSIRVVLGAENVEIVPAGEDRPNSGHHHLFLNAEPVDEGEVIPADVDGVVHLGQAQSEYSFGELPPGEYTLIAMIGDHLHRSIPQSADTVDFRVVDPSS